MLAVNTPLHSAAGADSFAEKRRYKQKKLKRLSGHRCVSAIGITTNITQFEGSLCEEHHVLGNFCLFEIISFLNKKETLHRTVQGSLNPVRSVIRPTLAP